MQAADTHVSPPPPHHQHLQQQQQQQQAAQAAQQEAVLHSETLLVAQAQAVDGYDGLAKADVTTFTPETHTCSMEQLITGSALGPPDSHDINLHTMEPMTQDLVIADSDAEEDGLVSKPAPVNADAEELNLSEPPAGYQLEHAACDDFHMQMLQLGLSPHATPPVSRKATGSAHASRTAYDRQPLMLPPTAVAGPTAMADDTVSGAQAGALISTHPAVNTAASSGDTAIDDAPLHDTLPDSCPFSSDRPSTSANRIPLPPAALPFLLPHAPTLLAVPRPAVAHDHNQSTAPGADRSHVVASATATAVTDATAVSVAMVSGPEPGDPPQKDQQPTCAASTAEAAKLQQRLLESHVPQQAVTAFLWSAVRHIVPQVSEHQESLCAEKLPSAFACPPVFDSICFCLHACG